MKHRIELFVGVVDAYSHDLFQKKVNTWLKENADKILVEKIEHQQSVDSNNKVQVTVMVHYLEK